MRLVVEASATLSSRYELDVQASDIPELLLAVGAELMADVAELFFWDPDAQGYAPLRDISQLTAALERQGGSARIKIDNGDAPGAAAPGQIREPNPAAAPGGYFDDEDPPPPPPPGPPPEDAVSAAPGQFDAGDTFGGGDPPPPPGPPPEDAVSVVQSYWVPSSGALGARFIQDPEKGEDGELCIGAVDAEGAAASAGIVQGMVVRTSPCIAVRSSALTASVLAAFRRGRRACRWDDIQRCVAACRRWLLR